MYIDRVDIENLRCFSRTKISLSVPGGPGDFPNVNVVLGNNGAGKTSLLRALAIGLISPVLRDSGFIPYQLVRSGHESATIRLSVHERLRDRVIKADPKAYKLRTQIIAKGGRETLEPWDRKELMEDLSGDFGHYFFLSGYSAERKVAPADGLNNVRFSNRYSRIASLFEYQTHYLTPIDKLWELAFPYQILSLPDELNSLLPDSLELRREFISDQRGTKARINYFWKGQQVDFNSLSDGYRAYLGWITDLTYHLNRVKPNGLDSLEIPGVVLVDEVDLHLHPEWQRAVVPTVARAFPWLQFIFTTHSPLVAASVPSERLIVMDEREDGSSFARHGEESLYGKMAHQVLQSDYFGLDTTRDQRFTGEIRELWLEASSGKNPDAAMKIQEMLASPEAHS